MAVFKGMHVCPQSMRLQKKTTFTKLFTNIQNRTSELDLLSDIFFLVPCGRKGFAAVWGFVEFVVTLNSRSAKLQPPDNGGLKYVQQHIWEYPSGSAQNPSKALKISKQPKPESLNLYNI